MRLDEGSAYDNVTKEDRGKKRDFRTAIASIICILILAVGGVLLFAEEGTDLSQENLPQAGQNSENADRTELQGSGLDVSAKIPTVDSKDAHSGEQAAESGGDGVFRAPIAGGTVGKKFSDTALQYSETLQQYVVHEGVDYEAPEGTGVCAPAEGTVTKVGKDDRYGMTVELTHGNGYVSRCCGLQETGLPEVGNVVAAGDPIGKVGATSLFESSDPPHLHFEILLDGEAVDPSGLIR